MVAAEAVASVAAEAVAALIGRFRVAAVAAVAAEAVAAAGVVVAADGVAGR